MEIVDCLHLPTLLLILLLAAVEVSGSLRCKENEFMCADESKCIPKEWYCDESADCLDTSDEPDTCPPFTCQKSQFTCRVTGKCIVEGWLCDGEFDCGDGELDSSDENPEICATNSSCPVGQTSCRDSSCIPTQWHCDNKIDCKDNSDEGPFCDRIDCGQLNCSYECRMSWSGPRCICPQGKQPAGTLCVDTNECAIDGTCDQVCRDLPGTYKCGCVPGYKFVPPSSCIAINQPENEPASLLVSTSDAVIHVNLDGKVINKLSALDSYSTDFNHRNRTICWISHRASNSQSSLLCTDIDMSHGWALPQPDLLSYSNVNSIAFDWASENWYYSDESNEAIFLCYISERLNEQLCKVIITTRMSKPRGLALDPSSGLMFFASSGSSPTKLETSLMDGTERRILVDSKIVYPYGIALDHSNRHVYWIDTYLDYVERCDYDGENRRTVVRGASAIHLYALSVFQTNVFLTSWKPNSILQLNRFNSSISSRLIELKSRPFSVHVYHRARQPMYTNLTVERHPCLLKKPCDHFCIPASGAPYFKCQCRAGFTLTEGGKCIRSIVKDILLFGQQNPGLIRGIKPEAGHAEIMVPVSGVSRPTTLAIDSRTNFLYFSDSQASKIERVKLFEDRVTKEDFITTGLNKVEGLAVDWIGANLYWSDEGLQAIHVASLNRPSLRKTLIKRNTSNVRSLIVEPLLGRLFWSNWNDIEDNEVDSGSIFCSGMDGTDIQGLVSTQLQWPNGLVFDSSSQILYWSDTFLNKIESLQLTITSNREISVSRRRVIVSGQKYTSRPYGLTKNENKLFWTEFINGNVIKHDLESNITSTLLKNNPQMFELKFYSLKESVTINSTCSSLRCEELCLLSPLGAVCACKDGFTLDADTGLCVEIPAETVTCQVDEFRCSEPPKCIEASKVCDGREDCQDGSDERVGGTCLNSRNCTEDEFTCGSDSSCISNLWICDGDEDCKDGSDETEQVCKSKGCDRETQFKCNQKGQCVPGSWECDGVPDCADASDEHLGCFNISCQQRHFVCDNYKCFPEHYKCDGERDCEDGSDEEGCPGMCGSNMFFCTSDSRCIHAVYMCNGQNDCSDGEDERNCPTQILGQCETSEFSCGDGTCIPGIFVCDGTEDCVDGCDENQGNCTKNCTSKERLCSNHEKCIPNAYWCDGDVDCKDGSDELECDSFINCPYPSFTCDTSLNKTKCISVERLCNKVHDCKDGSDEGLLCWEMQCSSKMNSCSDLCYNAPDGHRCACPADQHLDQTRKGCTDLHPCSQWGSCSQLCAQVSNTKHKCFCHPGYILQPDRFECKSEDDFSPQIVFTNRKELRSIDLRRGSTKTLLANLKNSIAIDFMISSNIVHLFWTDLADDCIYRGTLVDDMVLDVVPVLQSGLTTTEGIAVDWIGENLYWIETSLYQIEVAKLNGSYRKTLVSGNMLSPRALALDPLEALMFWTDWDSKGESKIESCSMDGNELSRKVVFVVDEYGGAWPNGLTIDHIAKRIYWIDARSDSVHTSMYDGTDHIEIARGHKYLSHPFSLTLFESNIFWTDWRTNSVLKANKWTGSNKIVMDKTLNKPYGIKVVHPSVQAKPRRVHPCQVNNGQCSHLCLLGQNNVAVCACPHIMKLAEDGKSCQESKLMLLYSMQNEIRGVDLTSLDHHLIPPIPYPSSVHPSRVNVLAASRDVYWMDTAGPSWPNSLVVRRATLNNDNINVKTVVDVNQGRVKSKQNLPIGGLSIDWISHSLFYSAPSDENSDFSTIYASKTDGTTTVRIKDLRTRVKDLIVAPEQGILFWSDIDLENNTENIMRSCMDGTSLEKIYSVQIQDDDDSLLQYLTLSEYAKTIYWMEGTRLKLYDIVTGRVESTPHKIERINALTEHKNILYFGEADGKQFKISSFNISSGKQSRMKIVQKKILSLKVYDDNMQVGKNRCSRNNGGCHHLCVPVQEGKSRCMCSIGYHVNSFNTSECVPITDFILYISESKIQGLSMLPHHGGLLVPVTYFGQPTALGYLASEELIFWIDNGVGEIWRMHRDGSKLQKILDKLKSPVGIAIDWVARNLYWTDDETDVIEVCRLDGKFRKVIISDGLSRPSVIDISPGDGFLFWIDTDISGAKLERSFLDGSGRKIISDDPNMSSVSDISVDVAGKWIYLCFFGSTLEEAFRRISFSGEHSEILKRKDRETIMSPMSITYYQKRLWWTDIEYNGGSISSFSVDDPFQIIVLKENLGDLTSLKGIQAYSQILQNQNVTNACQDENLCSELCLFTGKEAKCDCSFKKLSDDKHSCVNHEAFILFSGVSVIESLHLSLENDSSSPYPPIADKSFLQNAVGLAVDYKEELIFYSDIQTGSINSVYFNGTAFRRVLSNQGSAEGLAYDSLQACLYWTSASDSSIRKLDFKQKEKETVIELIVQLSPDDKPRGIDIDVCSGQIFWTNWNSRKPSIQRAFFSGYKKQDIVVKNIHMPNGISVDSQSRKLYWADARLDKIEMCNFDGSFRKIIVSSTVRHPFDITVFDQHLFYTDWASHSIIRINKLSGEDAIIMRKGIARPMGIIAVAENTSRCLVSSCGIQNGGCEDICVSNWNGSLSCKCTKGRHLLPDGQRCTSSSQHCNGKQFQCSNAVGAGLKQAYCIPYELTCDGIDHCPDGSDELVEYCSTRLCPNNFFQCANSKCIQNEMQCNGIDNCGDFSDETECTCNDLEKEFKCIIGPCISNTKVCNSIPDCPDASDEQSCPPVNCSSLLSEETEEKYYQCPGTTACMLPSWYCDGKNDCWDNADEKNCSSELLKNAICPNGTFECNDGRCIDLGWLCDSDKDCINGEDEENCTSNCGPGQFQCKNNNQCISSKWLCDGTPDCSDQSDEDCPNKECNSNQFECPNGKCIPKDWVCDGLNDCNSDESVSADEDLSICVNVCQENEFRCANGHCKYSHFYCDGDDDCGDKSDEPSSCVHESCPVNFIHCRSDKMCISKFQLCNGEYDCPDKSDEDLLFCEENRNDQEIVYRSGCKVNQFVCENKACIDFSLKCNGVNDCGDFSDEISCRNSSSQYERRKCPEGYQLSTVTGQCKAKSIIKPKILFSNRYYVRIVDLSGNSEIFAKNQTNAVALDFDYSSKCAFWSDVTSHGSSLRKMCRLGEKNETKIVNLATLQNPDGLAVDWIGKNLYWCDKGSDIIEVSNLSGMYRKIIVDKGLQEPRALALDPINGYLYWTDWGDKPYIGRSGMDGSNPDIIISENLGWPNALAIAFDTQELFYGDAKEDYIAYSNLDGTNVRKIVSRAKHPNLNLHHIFALTVFEDFLYWTDWETRSIERCNRYTCENPQTVLTAIHRPMDLAVYHPLRQPSVASNPCLNNGGCHGLCLLKPSNTTTLEHICACPENFNLGNDGISCVSNCSSSMFQCKVDLKCIPFWWQCDGQNDCSDGSDEPSSCGEFNCKPGQFQCKNSNCLHPTLICDSNNDCGDGSDEENCNEYECFKNQMKCLGNDSHDSFCIPLEKKCNKIADCPGGEDESQCKMQDCPISQFHCANGACIPNVWVCDEENDCGDNSDELETCKFLNRTCEEGFFKCGNGRCIPPSWKCDGEVDCSEKEDEPDSCTEMFLGQCEPTYFRCKSGRCIPGRWRCDHDYDCSDGSDEDQCAEEEYRSCSEDERACHNGKCIHRSKWCDGNYDCGHMDRSDEMFCSIECEENEYQCLYPPYCIYQEWKCDGERDCSDGSDEENCLFMPCKSDEFPCKSFLSSCNNGMCNQSKECINSQWKCDGDIDCTDGSDEEQGMCEKWVCEPNRFRCGNDKCILKSSVCDGVDDCRDGSDETKQACLTFGTCRISNSYRCNNNKCIDKAMVCDGNNDCLDGSDENDCISESICAFGKCSQVCEIKTDGTGKYTNHSMSRRCLCAPGYEQTEHKMHCKVVGNSPVLLVADENAVHYANPYKFGEMMKVDDHVLSMCEDCKEFKVGALDVLSSESIVILSMKNSDTLFFLPIDLSLGIDVKSDMRKMLLPNTGMPKRLAVDWVNRNIYWIDANRSDICLVNYDSGSVVTLIQNKLHKPEDIVVDPGSGKLFITDCGINPKILVAKLDGSDLRVLVESKVLWPVSLAIDYPAKRLYWTDLKYKSIESIKFDGKDRQLVTQTEPKVGKPFRIEIFEDTLYFSTFQFNKIFKIDKFGRNNVTIISENGLSISEIVMLHKRKQDDSLKSPCSANPCENHGKNAICISAMNNNEEYRCICSDSQTLKDDKCVQKPSKELDSCQNIDCHAGKCTEKYGEPFCQCNKFYQGKYCQNYICNNFCENEGKCIPVDSDKSSEAKAVCICKDGFEGEKCEIVTKDCRDYCLNNASCIINKNLQQMECICKFPFFGNRCEKCPEIECSRGYCALRESVGYTCKCPDGSECEEGGCENFECYHNGTCYIDSLSNQPQCECSDSMYTGRLCESDKCQSVFCRNGGSGHRENGKCICVCLKEYTGEKCEVPLIEYLNCEGIGACLNGGTCRSLNKTKLCECTKDFMGPTCSERISGNENPCKDIICQNSGVCQVIKTNNIDKEYLGKCVCDEKYTGEYCQFNNRCYKHCLNGGTCFSDGNSVRCHCPVGWTGGRCSLNFGVGSKEDLDNEAINSLTVTIVSVSIIALALLGVLVYLLVFLIQKRQLTSPFKHRRMENSGVRSSNVEFSNRMYLQDEDDDDGNFTLEDPQPSTNFVNPVYETMFLETPGSIIKEGALLNSSILDISSSQSERSGLLRSTQTPPRTVIHTDSD